MAEILEEFDQPSPCTVGFCQQIPLEDYDQRSAQTTQEALHGLLDHLDSNPKEFYKILRRKKADNLKLLQFVKVKVMNKLQEDYLEKYFPEEQCKKELESLKREMASAYDYAQDGKRTGVRFSKRLAEKRKLQEPLASSTPRIQPTAPPIPPPPPPPPPPVSDMSTASISPVTLKRKMPRVSLSDPEPSLLSIVDNDIISLTYSDILGTPSGTFHQEVKLVQSIRNIAPRKKLREINSSATVTSKCNADQANNNLKKNSQAASLLIEHNDIAAARNSLKATRPSNSDESPYQVSKARRKESEALEEENYSLFNMELLKKFQNTRSPSSSPSGNIVMSDSVFETPA